MRGWRWVVSVPVLVLDPSVSVAACRGGPAGVRDGGARDAGVRIRTTSSPSWREIAALECP